MDFIDVIFYINLESRTDRKEHFLSEITKLCGANTSKVVRIDAVRDANGALGCTKSHIKALELFLANSWGTCIVFEDDFTFYKESPEHNNARLANYFRKFTDWEMLILAPNHPRGLPDPTDVDGIKLVKYAHTTSGYCINKGSVKAVLENFKESAALLEKSSIKPQHALDVYWNKLEIKRHCFTQNLGYQYASHSDVENRLVNYGC